MVQWAAGHVGKVAIRFFGANPAYELAGVLSHFDLGIVKMRGLVR